MAELTEEQKAAIANFRARTITPAQQAAIDRVQAENPNFLQRAGKVVSDTANQLMEIPAGSNRSLGAIADVALSPFIAAERQIRPYAQAALGQREMPASPRSAYRSTEPFSFRKQMTEKGEFGGEGIVTDTLAGIGGLIPASLSIPVATEQLITRMVANPEGRHLFETIKGIGREGLRTTAAQEVGYGTAAVVGGEAAAEVLGEDRRLVGQLFAPIMAAPGAALVRGGRNVLERMFDRPSALEEMMHTLNSYNDDIAADLLAEAMVREQMSVSDVMQRLDDLGPDAITADASQSFRRLLRAAGNTSPRIQGRSGQVLTERHAGQAERIARDVDLGLQTPDMTVEEAIEFVKNSTQPLMNEFYQTARDTPFAISGRLKNLLEGDSSMGRARESIEQRLSDKRAVGDQITHFDLIDATKQELDDQIGVAIRQGESGKARDLIRLKNILIEEADAAIPEYKKARNIFAGTEALKSAAEQGRLFLKMNPRKLSEVIGDMSKNMSNAEMNMFRLGAREAIFDTIDVTQSSSELTKRLFGRNGDIRKLRSIFPDNESFNAFERSLRTEAEFIFTRRAAMANSNTVQQAEDITSSRRAMARMANFLGNPVQTLGEITNVLDGLSQGKETAAYARALERAGDILLATTDNPEQIRALLSRGNTRRLRLELEKATSINRPSARERVIPQAIRSSILVETTGDN